MSAGKVNRGKGKNAESREMKKMTITTTQFNESEISEMTKVFGTEPIWHSDDYIGTISDGELQIDIYKLLDGNYKLVYGFKNDFNQYQDYETDTLNDLPELVKIAYASKKKMSSLRDKGKKPKSGR